MLTKKIKINNPTGIDLKFAGEVCKSSMDYKSKIILLTENSEINIKSILNLLGADIKYGQEGELICEGSDEETAFKVILDLLEGVCDAE